MVGAGENEGRPESRSRRSASVLGAFLGAGLRTSELETMSWAEIDPTKALARRKGRRIFGMVRNGELPKVFPAKRGGAWGKRERV